MATFDLYLNLSSVYSSTAPTFEVLIDGVVVSSLSVTSSFTPVTLSSLIYNGDAPGYLSFRFNDANGEVDRSVTLNEVRINGNIVGGGSLSRTLLEQGQESQLDVAAEQASFGIPGPGAGTDAIINGTAGVDNLNGTTGNDTINGLGDRDWIKGNGGIDTINGGAGHDIIKGGDGDDIINGDADNDLLKGDAGNDTINGGIGNDTLDGGTGADALNGDDGNDVLKGGAGIDTLRGGNDNDKVFGGDDGDFIYGDAGNDKLMGENGNDSIYGGIGNDTLFGGAGVDLLDGEGGSDRLYGDAGNDTMYGRAGNDKIFGGADNDTIFGGTGNDKLFGEGGNDTINGEDGNDRIVGGGGIDTIDGGDGIDNIDGNDGNDIISGGLMGDLIKGGNGDDTINGDDGDDNLYGQAGNDTINGGTGDDFIYGKDDNDILNGDAGNDMILGGDGIDTINGGADDDVIYGDGGEGATGWYYEYYNLGSSPTTLASAGFTLNGGIDNANAETSRGVTKNLDPATFDTGDNYALKFETYLTITTAGTYNFQTRSDDGSMLFLDGVQIVNNDGLHSAVTVTSAGQVLAAGIYKLDATFFERTGGNVMEVNMAGPDTGGGYISLADYTGVNAAKSVYTVFTGDDVIDGGAGNDTIFGDGGNDTITGGAGDDVLYGGAGTDIASFATATGAVTASLITNTATGQGIDTLDSIEGLIGSDFADTLTGNNSANTLDGGAGADVIISGTQEKILVNAGTLLSYGGGQDAGGVVNYMDDDVGVELDGNLWKQFSLNYTVTANTVIEFDFRSTNEAEISGIGFDTDNGISSGYTFKVFGTQNWGITTYDNYDGSGNWVHYEINVGAFYTGNFTRLFLVNDDDGGGDDGEGYWRNIVINEGNGGNNDIIGGAGADELYGDSGLDTFIFEDTASIDIIHNFNLQDGDILDLSTINAGYTGAITDFIRFTNAGDNVTVAVDVDGTTGGANFVDIAELRGQADLDEATLFANGNIVV